MKNILGVIFIILFFFICLYRFMSLSFIVFKTDNNIIKDKVVIEYNSPIVSETNSGNNKIELTYRNKVVVSNGKRHIIPEEYGENDFQLIYDDKWFGAFRHFKKRKYQDFVYSFYFYLQEEGVKCDIKIYGIKGLVRKTTIDINGNSYQYLGFDIPNKIAY